MLERQLMPSYKVNNLIEIAHHVTYIYDFGTQKAAGKEMTLKVKVTF